MGIEAITLCSSSKFYRKTEQLAAELQRARLQVYTPRFDFNEETRTVSKEEKFLLTTEFLGKIKRSSHVYVIAEHGYTGVSVCLEVGFAYGLGRYIIASEAPVEPAVEALITEIVPVSRIAGHLLGANGDEAR